MDVVAENLSSPDNSEYSSSLSSSYDDGENNFLHPTSNSKSTYAPFGTDPSERRGAQPLPRLPAVYATIQHFQLCQNVVIDETDERCRRGERLYLVQQLAVLAYNVLEDSVQVNLLILSIFTIDQFVFIVICHL